LVGVFSCGVQDGAEVAGRVERCSCGVEGVEASDEVGVVSAGDEDFAVVGSVDGECGVAVVAVGGVVGGEGAESVDAGGEWFGRFEVRKAEGGRRVGLVAVDAGHVGGECFGCVGGVAAFAVPVFPAVVGAFEGVPDQEAAVADGADGDGHAGVVARTPFGPVVVFVGVGLVEEHIEWIVIGRIVIGVVLVVTHTHLQRSEIHGP